MRTGPALELLDVLVVVALVVVEEVAALAHPLRLACLDYHQQTVRTLGYSCAMGVVHSACE